MTNQAVTVQTIQNTIITLPGREPFMLGQDLAVVYETEPRLITRAVRRNPARFDSDFVFQLTDEETAILKSQFGTSNLSAKANRGNPIGFTQAGANMLSVVLNSPIAVERSKQIIRAFTAMEVMAANEELKAAKDALRKARQAEHRAQLEWQDARISGELARREETDAIQEFVGYARGQGSKNAQQYYLALSKMVNKELFLMEASVQNGNLRNHLDAKQLTTLKVADRVVARALREGMASGRDYKIIFAEAKGKIKLLAQLIGKTSPAMLGGPANTQVLLVTVA